MILKNDMQVKNTKLPAGKVKTKLSAGAGLYLLINKSGKYWRHNYVYDGKRKVASLGVYAPGAEKHVSLKEAKSRVQAVKDMLMDGIDPNTRKQEQRQANIEATRQAKKQHAADGSTFEVVARQWFNIHKTEWVESNAVRQIRRLERHLFPPIGSIPVAQLTKKQLADALTVIAATGSHDIARRIAQLARSVLTYACDRGLINGVPMGDMKSLLPTPVAKPMPAILEPKRIGELMRAIYSYGGTFVVCCALKLLPLLAVRSGEFRTAEWCEIDMNAALWTIPAAHRKLKKAAKANPANVHLVPLSRQAIAILKELQTLTGTGVHVFPSARGDFRPMSENAVNGALHAMGFKGEMVGHGVRAMFSTSLNKQGFNADAIERQLAHCERNAVRAAYNRAEYMDERKKLMQHWADYLDGLRDGADVIPIKQGVKR